MLPANVCAGFFCSCYGEWGGGEEGRGGLAPFGLGGGSLGPLCVWEMLVLLVFSLILTGFGLRRCVFCWIRFLGEGWWGHFFRNSRGVSWITQKKCCSVSLGV